MFNIVKYASLALFALTTSLGTALAAETACVVAGPTGAPPNQMTAEGVADLVKGNPLGGTAMANQIRDAILWDASLGFEALKLVPAASEAQQRSLGLALGQAAAICTERQPKFAQDFRRMVAELGKREVAQSFEFGSGLSLSRPLTAGSDQCFQGGAPMTAEAIRDVNANPKKLLLDNPNGGSGLSMVVRNLALSDPANVSMIFGLVPDASMLQRSAIAAGLGQAVVACEARAPAAAQGIQRMVAAGGDVEFQAIFLSVTGNRATAAIGFAGPPGARGGGGGGPVGNTAIAGVGQTAGAGPAGFGVTRQTTSSSQFSVDPGSISSSTGSRSRTVYIGVSP